MPDKNKFKAYCEEHGYTARYVANLCGLSHYTVWAYMQGVRSPSRKNLKIMKEKLEGFEYEIFI